MSNEAAAQTMQPFHPWKKNLSNGFVAMGVLAIIYLSSSIFKMDIWKVVIAGAAVSIYAAWQFKQASVRSFGQRLEKRSIKRLTSVLGQDNVRGNLPFPGNGDIDCVARINGNTFNIEIKAFRDIKRINSANIKQTLAAANYLDSKPVIWLPNYKDVQFGERNGVTLCACDAKRLVKKLA